MTTDPVGTYLSVCGAFRDLTEQGKDNHGQIVEWFLKFNGLAPGNPWCCAYVSYAGHFALLDHATLRSAWPLPYTGSCKALAAAAAKRGVLFDEPEVGDLAFIWYPKLNRFGHVAVIRGLPATPTLPKLTYEGNTSGGGKREGWGCFARERQFAPRDKFARWRLLL